MRPIKNKKTNKHIFFRLNIGLISVLVMLYIAQLALANHAAAQRYELAQYHDQKQAIVLEKQRLSVRVAELQSLTRLTTEGERLQLVKAPVPVFVYPAGSVALKQN